MVNHEVLAWKKSWKRKSLTITGPLMKDITMLPFQCATQVRFLHGTSNQLTPVLHKKLFWPKKIYSAWRTDLPYLGAKPFDLTVRVHWCWIVVLTFKLRLSSCSFTTSAELRSLNGRVILKVFALFRSFLMAVLIKFGGYFQNTSLSRSHSSWKSDQSGGNLYARSSMELNGLRLCRISTWLWWWSRIPVLVGLMLTLDSILGARFSNSTPTMGSDPSCSIPMVNFKDEWHWLRVFILLLNTNI